MRILGGTFKNRKLVVPPVRPTTGKVREALFNICQGWIEGARVLDLFAGAGAVGFEAVSRGAAHVTFVEKATPSLSAIRQNVKLLDIQHSCRILARDVLKALTQLAQEGSTFDLIFADPPYGEGWSDRVLTFLDTHPLLSSTGSLFIEDSTPPTAHTSTLILKSSRRHGKAYLQEYALS